MDATQRNRDGTFKTGHKSKGGRPPNNFSIGAALSKSANEVETVTDDGTPVTRAPPAARASASRRSGRMCNRSPP